jgi:hypothetical protein
MEGFQLVDGRRRVPPLELSERSLQLGDKAIPLTLVEHIQLLSPAADLGTTDPNRFA